MVKIRPDHECTPEGQYVYFVTYVGEGKSGRNFHTGWLTVTTDRLIRCPKDIIYLSNLVKSMTKDGGFLQSLKDPTIQTFVQIEANPEDEDSE